MDSDDTQQPVVSEPAGQQLKRAREQKGLSVSAVADAQHLRPAVIQAIEDGDYGQIDSELFLKGYVRTYAQQVDLDPDAVIATLDRELEPLRQQKVQAEEANPLVDIERRRRQKRRIAKFFLFILAIAIAVFVGLRFMDNMGTTFAPDEPDNAETVPEAVEPEESRSDNGLSPDIDTGADADADAGAAETARVEPQPVDPVVEEPAISDPDAPAPQERQEEGLAGDSPVSDIDEDRVPMVTSNPEPAFEESVQPEAVAPSTRLEMTFSDECWVQVTDSAGNRLVSSLQRDGDRINVSGRVPIRVVVGAVDAIESIRFDGEAVDMSGFRVVNNRAEFTLDI
ncbi:DUF4115 domain-containing protein [Marinobacter sp. TBZ242]|uniref:DUF4115 domain-containing protein n=1 Tax=Marinobacter azerbaijanicus TaxID=3050455 RepID=A0ABT7IG00_9GAMM|nr:RodZ domain-containing protein [Marinobacter sp. TBZ242]MDL0433103.1 DUF4115 domain-containing protein [Marinobacter sp. TBZ242]